MTDRTEEQGERLVDLRCRNCGTKWAQRDLEDQKGFRYECPECNGLLESAPRGVEKAIKFLEHITSKSYDDAHEAADTIRDRLRELREERDRWRRNYFDKNRYHMETCEKLGRLQRAAREARDLARSHFDGDAWHHARERLRSVLDRLDAALDEREGHAMRQANRQHNQSALPEDAEDDGRGEGLDVDPKDVLGPLDALLTYAKAPNASLEEDVARRYAERLRKAVYPPGPTHSDATPEDRTGGEGREHQTVSEWKKNECPAPISPASYLVEPCDRLDEAHAHAADEAANEVSDSVQERRLREVAATINARLRDRLTDEGGRDSAVAASEVLEFYHGDQDGLSDWTLDVLRRLRAGGGGLSSSYGRLREILEWIVNAARAAVYDYFRGGSTEIEVNSKMRELRKALTALSDFDAPAGEEGGGEE